MRPLESGCAVVLFLAAACGASPGDAARCGGPSDCAAGAFCRSGRCIASAPPVAVATPPSAGPLPSHSLLRFDGAGSRDPDPEDAVVEWAWTARPVSAGCDPFPTAAAGTSVDLVFGCAGAFEVVLVVKDGTGLPSAPAVLEVAVDLSADVPSVRMGPDLVVDHSCQGAPLLCAALPRAGDASLSLSAAAASPISGSFTYEWIATPPAISPAPRIVLDPPGSPAPQVRIETDGTAIAGDYLFTVRATDAYHLVAVGQQRISVGNRPPILAGGGPVAAPHSFDPAGRRFLASGSVAAVASDPDGDPVTSLGFSASHAGDGAGTFEVSAGEWAADFAISVPYAAPSDGAFLIGGAGLSRTIALAAADANGARAVATWQVEVANRPPQITGAPGTVAVDHRFDPAGSRYLAAAGLFAVLDPDGDPIVQWGPTGDAACATLPEVVGSGVLSVECSVPYAGVPAVGRLVGTHPVRVAVGDPWLPASVGTASVAIGNRAPRVPSATAMMPVSCGVPFCCAPHADTCTKTAYHGAGTAAVPVAAVDDDGDPIRIDYAPPPCAEVAPASLTCASSPCEVEASLCAEVGACGQTQYPVAVSATDGVDSATGTLALATGCVPPP